MINALLGKKLKMSAGYDEKGTKIPVTLIEVGPCFVVQIKTKTTDGYFAAQIGLGTKKPNRTTKPILGHVKKAGLSQAPRFLQEVKFQEEPACKVGDILKVGDVFSPGDNVSFTGISKGKGFAGVMKRWGFAGGPRTHGQSDRARSLGTPGAEGPGRIFPGKKMPGHMGNRRVTVKGLTVVDVDPKTNLLTVKGAVPGSRKGLLLIKKIGKAPVPERRLKIVKLKSHPELEQPRTRLENQFMVP